MKKDPKPPPPPRAFPRVSSVFNVGADQPPRCEPDAIDGIDLEILRELQAQGRRRSMHMAAKLKVTPSFVCKRIKRMQGTRHILGFEAVLNPEKFPGTRLLVFTKVRFCTTDPKLLEEFKDAARSQPSVLECHVLESRQECLLKVRAADIKDYHHMISALLLPLSGISAVHSQVVLEEVKQIRGVLV